MTERRSLTIPKTLQKENNFLWGSSTNQVLCVLQQQQATSAWNTKTIYDENTGSRMSSTKRTRDLKLIAISREHHPPPTFQHPTQLHCRSQFKRRNTQQRKYTANSSPSNYSRNTSEPNPFVNIFPSHRAGKKNSPHPSSFVRGDKWRPKKKQKNQNKNGILRSQAIQAQASLITPRKRNQEGKTTGRLLLKQVDTQQQMASFFFIFNQLFVILKHWICVWLHTSTGQQICMLCHLDIKTSDFLSILLCLLNGLWQLAVELSGAKERRQWVVFS